MIIIDEIKVCSVFIAGALKESDCMSCGLTSTLCTASLCKLSHLFICPIRSWYFNVLKGK